MTAKEMAEVIGNMGSYLPDGYLEFTVKVIDVRTVYGRTDYLIKPDSGNGEKWVSDNKVRMWK